MSRRSRARGATGCGCARRSTRSSARRGPRAGHVRGAARRSASTRSCSPLTPTRRCDARRRQRARARDPRRDPLPAQRGGAAHRRAACFRAAAARGRAGTTTCSTSPAGRATVTYHMNRLQSLQAEREFCVTLNRTEAIDPAQGDPHDPLRPPGLHGRRRPRAGTPARRSAVATARTTAARTGAGASTRTASSAALARRPSASGCDCEHAHLDCERTRGAAVRKRDLRGHCAPPPLRGARARVPPPARARLHRPRRAARAAGRASAVARSPGSLRFRRRDYLGDPDRPLADAVRDTASRPSRGAPAGPIRLLTNLRSFGHCFNPVSFYYCLDPAGEQLEAVAGGGHQHALGRAPRLRARSRRRTTEVDGVACSRQLRQGAARLAVHGDGPQPTRGA